MVWRSDGWRVAGVTCWITSSSERTPSEATALEYDDYYQRIARIWDWEGTPAADSFHWIGRVISHDRSADCIIGTPEQPRARFPSEKPVNNGGARPKRAVENSS